MQDAKSMANDDLGGRKSIKEMATKHSDWLKADRSIQLRGPSERQIPS